MSRLANKKYVPDRIESKEQKQHRLENFSNTSKCGKLELVDLYSENALTADELNNITEDSEYKLYQEQKMSIRLEGDCLVIDYKLLKKEYEKLKKLQNREEMARFIISVKNRIKTIKD